MTMAESEDNADGAPPPATPDRASTKKARVGTPTRNNDENSEDTDGKQEKDMDVETDDEPAPISSHPVTPNQKGNWNHILPSVLEHAVPFVTFFGSEEKGNAYQLHDLCNQFRHFFKLAHGLERDPTKEETKSIFLQVLKRESGHIGTVTYKGDGKLRVLTHKLISGLALSDPKDLFKDEIKDENIRRIFPAVCWRCAVDTVGSHYDFVPSKKRSKATMAQSTLTFGPNDRKKATGGRGSGPTDRSPTATVSPDHKSKSTTKNTKKKSSHKTPKGQLEKEQQVIDPMKIKHQMRYDISIACGKGTSDPESWQNSKEWIADWLGRIHEHVDPNVYILPWYSKAKVPVITNPEMIDNLNKMTLGKYFKGIKPPTNNGVQYTSVCLACSREFAPLIQSEMEWYFQSSGGRMYEQCLPNAENPREIGLFIYTGNFTCPKATQLVINEDLKRRGIQLEVGCKLKRVIPGKLPGCKIDDRQFDDDGNRVGWFNRSNTVIHALVDHSQLHSSKRHLCSIWNDVNTPQPGGLRMRFMPSMSLLVTTKTGTEKYSKMWERHEKYVKQLQTVRSQDIRDLDVAIAPDDADDDKTPITLREWLGEFENDKGEKLFKGARPAPNWDQNAGVDTILVALPKDLALARSVISTAPAVACRDFAEKDIRNWFTDMAIQQAAECVIDDDGKIVETADENMMDALLMENVGVEIELPESLKTDMAKDNDDSDDDGSKSAYSFRTTWSADSEDPLKEQKNSQTLNTDNKDPPSPAEMIDTAETTTAETSALTDNDQLHKMMEKLLLMEGKMVELQQDNEKYKKQNELLAAKLTDLPEDPSDEAKNETDNEEDNTDDDAGQDDTQANEPTDKREVESDDDNLSFTTLGDKTPTQDSKAFTPSNVQGHVEGDSRQETGGSTSG